MLVSPYNIVTCNISCYLTLRNTYDSLVSCLVGIPPGKEYQNNENVVSDLNIISTNKFHFGLDSNIISMNNFSAMNSEGEREGNE